MVAPAFVRASCKIGQYLVSHTTIHYLHLESYKFQLAMLCCYLQLIAESQKSECADLLGYTGEVAVRLIS